MFDYATPQFTRAGPTIRWSERIIPLSHANHQCGRVAWTPAPQAVPVESQLESRAVEFLTGFDGLIGIFSQPFTIHLADSRRTYTPDLLAVFCRLSRTLQSLGFALWTVIEVKPAELAALHAAAIAARLKLVRELLGFATVCLTERELGQGRALQ